MSATTELLEAPSARESRFDWPLCYEAEKWVLAQLESFLARNGFARELSRRMADETGTLFLDWVDHIVIPPGVEQTLSELGFQRDEFGAYTHPEAMLPRVRLQSAASVAIRVDSIADFMLAHRITGEPEGETLSQFRRLCVSTENNARFEVVERRGYRGFDFPSNNVSKLLKAHELWRTRPRIYTNDKQGFAEALALIDRLVELVGRDLACHVVFAEERAYWERRNRAAQVQKKRQDSLGLGWANHDHHTFRSSREHFVDLMHALEKLGFERRERYYAGAQAGWGAQILEQPVEGIVAFCDVDLQADETEIDFSRRVLPPAKKLGTVGLWVGLHGESFLQAGLHHLECRFDYELLRDQLSREGVQTMKPFSDFPFLKQAFTEGERWPVDRSRSERLVKAGLINPTQFEEFAAHGAIGSHLENLQRKGGFKGFNQKSVSVIIEATDPRKQNAH